MHPQRRRDPRHRGVLRAARAPVRGDLSVERRYHLRHCLGRGGFGEVYLAVMESDAVRTEVAVKLLAEGVDPGTQALERLRDEARILGLLNHPVILKVHDLQVLQGRVALITEYVDGADLQQCFAAGDLPPRTLVEVIGRVADALAVAWSAPSPTGARLELCHRDVKPANIRLGRHGDVKLLDFGIARAELPREARTETMVVIGTLAYMAPERIDASSPIEPAGDVYALGAVLYEGLSGEQLFGALSTREQYLLQSAREPHDAFVAERQAHLEGAPEALVELVGALLAYEPADRPAADEVASRCEQLAEALPGAGLRRYCRERDWPPPPPIQGALDGVTLAPDATSVPVPVPAPAPSRGWVWVAALVAAFSVLGAGGVLLAVVGVAVGIGVTRVPSPPVVPIEPVVVVAPPPAPEPAVPAPIPTPVPAPTRPTPVPAAPAPAEPDRSESTFVAAGDVQFELRLDGKSYGPGPVPAGVFEIWADFGSGPQLVGTTTAPPGRSFVVRCSRLRQNCAGAP